MEIKPMFDQTIKMNIQSISLDKVSHKRKEEDNSIPNGIYRVIRWERIRQWVTTGINISIILGMIILISIYASQDNVKWSAYIIPVVTLLLSVWKLFITLIEKSSLNNDVIRYREDLKHNLTSTPPFIARMYRSLYIKQVSHNWLTIFIMFYGGIATLLLWWLKDVSWWIFDFKTWIQDLFESPTTMAWIFTITLIAVAVIHIIFAIQRKKRIVDIDSYFGQSLESPGNIIAIKSEKNKAYRRIFIFSLMILLVIPVVVRFILRRLGRRR